MEALTIRGVIFDLGSTLIEFKGDYNRILPESIAAIADHLLEQGTPIERGAFMRKFQLALQDDHRQRDEDHIERSTYAILTGVLTALGLPLPDESTLRDGLTAMYAVSESFWQAKPGMRPMLDQLSAAGYRLALLSNAGDEANVQRLIDKVAIRDYFDPIYISAAIGVRKPDPRPIHEILNHWGFSTGEVLMIGDLLEADILGAQRAGIMSIWMNSSPDLPETTNPRPDAITGNLAELPIMIQDWYKKGRQRGV